MSTSSWKRLVSLVYRCLQLVRKSWRHTEKLSCPTELLMGFAGLYLVPRQSQQQAERGIRLSNIWDMSSATVVAVSSLGDSIQALVNNSGTMDWEHRVRILDARTKYIVDDSMLSEDPPPRISANYDPYSWLTKLRLKNSKLLFSIGWESIYAVGQISVSLISRAMWCTIQRVTKI